MSDEAERLVSKKRFAELTGFDRGTIDGWVKKGCPIERTEDGDYLVDIRAVWRWREEHVKAEALKAAGVGEGEQFAGWLGIKDPGKAFAAQQRLLNVKRDAGDVHLNEHGRAVMQTAMGLIRQAMMAVPDRLARDMAGFPKERVADWRQKAIVHHRNALAEGQKLIDRDYGRRV